VDDSLVPIRRLLEGAVDAAVILDRDRRIVYYNRAYEALSGSRGRALRKQVEEGARCYEVFPLEICESSCVGCKAREVGRPLRVDEIKALGSGTEEETKTFIVAAVPMGDEYIIETYRDVTANVRIQRRLKVLLERERRAKEALEDRVESRTTELRNVQAQLVHQEKMSSLGRLVAGIAHELNNPINFVYGNVDFLGQYMEQLFSLIEAIESSENATESLKAEIASQKEQIEYDYLTQDTRKLIGSIRSGAERTATIVRDRKNFSRSGSGGALRETDLVTGIETTLNLIAPLHKNRIAIERNYDSDVPKIVCHAGHINQVFMNILTNAAQAIKGTGEISIYIGRAGTEAIRVAITDSGAGIPANILEQLTDPFFTTKEVGTGTGLGLWITESIINAHGGELRVESQEGKGATFTVVLPLEPPESAGTRTMIDGDD
jgi:signal transduction histidine kinase